MPFPLCTKPKLLFMLLCILFLFSECSSICSRFVTPYPHPHPCSPRSDSTSPMLNSNDANLKHFLLFTVILLYVLGKVTSLYHHSVQYVPFGVRLNLKKTNKLINYNCCYIEILTFSCLLLLNSENFISVLVSVYDEYSFSKLLSFMPNGTNLLAFYDIIENFFKITLLINTGFCLLTPIMSQCLFYIFKSLNPLFFINSTTWLPFLLIIWSNDIHLNPGPHHVTNKFSSGFLSFCNWNLNTLSKDDFYRITLLQAHNTEHNYDIISLCETSLNDTIQVSENSFPGYKFHSCDHPDGNRDGGVGIFYKESLPLRIREDLAFDEVIVAELIFSRKKIFFTVLYRNPHSKAQSPEFNTFLTNLENLYLKIKSEKPYAMFFTGDFNGHSQSWYPDGDTNAEGLQLDNLFSNLGLSQMISEPTHFMRDNCKPSCIDLILTDQPNLVLESGVRASLDQTVKHQIIFCKL